MTNIERVNNFLDEAKTFYFLTTDGDKPKGRPFGFHMLDDGKLYFGCGNGHAEIRGMLDLKDEFDV